MRIVGENPASTRIDDDAGQLTSEVIRQMRRRWRDGERWTAEAVFARHPQLANDPQAAIDLVYEEYCLRQAGGDADAEQDLMARFPQWAGQLRVMLDCHRIIQSNLDRTEFPVAGERIGEFKLISEIARGARGRVFLAAQSGLGDRPMVLKITPLDGGEHLSLARLQHTNIVPLYSAFDDTQRGIRVLCMPYFGRCTLATLLTSLNTVPMDARTGQHIIDVIDRSQQSLQTSTPDSAARQMLATVSYVQAMCWITASLADALQFAHERGLVHLDLKPSNILLSTDGQPMLLDFHLAREPITGDSPLPENLGGTPPYMPPEQRRAIELLREGKSAPMVIDRRADIYALGAMLYEALGGQLPMTPQSPPLSQINQQVSPGLSDIVARCVAQKMEDRYADAQSLADDLRRYLTDQPLTGVPNRSASERWQKWRRRRPNILRAAAMMVIVLAAGIIALSTISARIHDRHEQAQAALDDGRNQLQQHPTRSQSIATFERGLHLIDNLPFQRDLRLQLQQQLALARRLHLADQLHQLADEIRVLYCSIDSIPLEQLRPLAAQCNAYWDKRRVIIDSLTSAKDETDVTADLKDIAIFAAASAPRLNQNTDALRLLDEVAASFGPSPILQHERQRYLNENNQPISAAPRTAWEHYALGRALLVSGDLPEASRYLASARAMDPAGRWTNFYYGLCAYRQRRYDDALAAFSICIGTAPNVAGCYYNRALAYSALNRHEQAVLDYDTALQIDPKHAAAALNRGMLHFQQKRLAEAAADLRLALENGADPATVHYDLALVHMAANNNALALQHVRNALDRNPQHQQAAKLREVLQQN